MSDKLAAPMVTPMKMQGSRYAQCSSETMQQAKIASVPQKNKTRHDMVRESVGKQDEVEE